MGFIQLVLKFSKKAEKFEKSRKKVFLTQKLKKKLNFLSFFFKFCFPSKTGRKRVFTKNGGVSSHNFEQTISRQPLNLLHRELRNIFLPEMSQRFPPCSDCRLSLSCDSSLVVGTILPNLRACCWNSDLI